ncbi:hypothetical protein [uncultured Eudoraea sp.]|uniref:hypothetical protein n=1 Tax=uncultured Eudoraea sp. TaxID=1035614 RepID=UPI00345C00CA
MHNTKIFFILTASLFLDLICFNQYQQFYFVFLDGIVDRSELNTNKALPYPPVRAADILWEKRIWRVIDTREKINLPFR